MRLRAFTAATMDQAMRDMRRGLGAGATVLMSNQLDTGVRLLAAEASPEPGRHRALFAALAAHGAPAPLIAAVRAHPGTPGEAMAACLPFSPLVERPILLVGPPGSGKTLTAVRLAARAVFARQPIALMTADDARAGAGEELERLASVLGLTIHRVAPATIDSAIREFGPRVVIDTPACNPFDPDDLMRVAGLIAASRADPVVVLPAGLDGDEATDTAHSFAALGATRVITTRLDAARRWGAMFAAASAGLAIGMVGVARHIANSLVELSPEMLARAIVDPRIVTRPNKEAS